MKKICPLELFDTLKKNQVDFYSGVPDSVLKLITKIIEKKVPKNKHIITTNEGNAVALTAGYHLATQKIGLVYLQNSGLGNAINPLTSLTNKSVYSIPMILMIGWRGQPLTNDEPQHQLPGKILLQQLKLLDIKYYILSSNNFREGIKKLIVFSKKEQKPVAIIVKKNSFEESFSKNLNIKRNGLSRSLAISSILEKVSKKDLVISTTGIISREILKFINNNKISDENFFFNVGAMGHVSSISLGVALNTKKNVICIDGDGSHLMHQGGVLLAANFNLPNLRYFLLNNGVHESVGGQKTIGLEVNFKKIAASFGFKFVRSCKTTTQLLKTLYEIKKKNDSCFIEIKTDEESFSKLPRPKKLLKAHKKKILNFLKNKNV